MGGARRRTEPILAHPGPKCTSSSTLFDVTLGGCGYIRSANRTLIAAATQRIVDKTPGTYRPVRLAAHGCSRISRA
jgi:hypothetical protein